MPDNSHSAVDSRGSYFELSGKVVLVTGASSGLGRHFSGVLAGAGCKVAVTARREPQLVQLIDGIVANGGQAQKFLLDVNSPASIAEAVEAIETELGPIEILINNAGIAVTQRFIDATEADTRSVFETNQMAVWNVAQRVSRQMISNRVKGTIINIASIGGLRQFAGAASYNVSKAAVVQLTRVMALELARHDIRVNAIAPGYFSTEMNSEFLASEAGQKMLSRSPMRRAGQLHELDGLLLLLASEHSAFMTGAVIPVDGGHTVSSL
jgi:NAD(P)-dependent dehydrogenase (short-subunit alcohol dehydrogenase family)